MSSITVKDGTEIYYKDWGTGQPIMFHHGWPLSADDWDSQMLFFRLHGYRVLAHDRRWPWPINPDRSRQRHGHLRGRQRRPGMENVPGLH
jgi:pimeloyl-ACP methyl ester carboxylesterase